MHKLAAKCCYIWAVTVNAVAVADIQLLVKTGKAESDSSHSVCKCCNKWSLCCREGGSRASPLLADPRVNQLTNGGLEISNVTREDEGFYTCSVLNHNLSVSAELEVLSEWSLGVSQQQCSALFRRLVSLEMSPLCFPQTGQ